MLPTQSMSTPAILPHAAVPPILRATCPGIPQLDGARPGEGNARTERAVPAEVLGP